MSDYRVNGFTITVNEEGASIDGNMVALRAEGNLIQTPTSDMKFENRVDADLYLISYATALTDSPSMYQCDGCGRLTEALHFDEETGGAICSSCEIV